jgi:hypothetical protein
MVCNVYKFVKTESEVGITIPLSKVTYADLREERCINMRSPPVICRTVAQNRREVRKIADGESVCFLILSLTHDWYARCCSLMTEGCVDSLLLTELPICHPPFPHVVLDFAGR